MIKCREMEIIVKRSLHDGIAVLTAVNRAETWSMGVAGWWI